MKPTIGRIVHYRKMHTDTNHAAIISAVEHRESDPLEDPPVDEENNYLVTLHVLAPYGIEVVPRVRFSKTENKPDHWFWPVRED